MPGNEKVSSDQAPSTDLRGPLILGTLILAELVSAFEGSMIYAALKTFYEIYDNPIGIGWLVSSYMLVASIAAAICGRLGDMYGRRKVLCIALLIAFAGSVISALSTQLEWIILGRGIQGLSGAILPLCYGLVRQHFPSEKMKLNIGIISATASGGAGIGVILGGFLVDSGSWRTIFVLSASLALFAAFMAHRFLPKDNPRFSGPIDWLGAIMFILGIGLILYALGLSEKGGWGNPTQLRTALAGGAILALWAVYEFRLPDPMINVRQLATRQIWATLLIFMLASLGSLNISQVVLVMLQQPVETGIGLGLSATMAGTVHLPASIMGVIASPLIGWLAARRGGKWGMVAALSTLTCAWLGLALAHGSVSWTMLWMAVNGFGMGALMAAAPILIVEVAPEDRVSETTGMAQIVRKISMAVGAQVIAVSLAQATVTVGGGTYPAPFAYGVTFWLIAAVNISGLFLCLALPKSQRP
jgi:MFS family permease